MNKQTIIQDAVAKIILTEGAVSVSTTKVAKLAHIAQSNVYLYFKDKQALLDSVYNRERDRIINTTDIAELRNHDIDIENRIRYYIEQVYDYSLTNPDSMNLIEQIKFLMGEDDGLVISDSPNDIVHELLQEAMDNQVIKKLPINFHMGIVFSTIHRHTNNIIENKYSKSEYKFETIYQFIWDAMRIN
nr:TetR/AcrR family transcriptional regulator [Lentilactobacillus sp. SPB1-3]